MRIHVTIRVPSCRLDRIRLFHRRVTAARQSRLSARRRLRQQSVRVCVGHRQHGKHLPVGRLRLQSRRESTLVFCLNLCGICAGGCNVRDLYVLLSFKRHHLSVRCLTSQYDGTELDAAAIILNNLQVECDLPEILYSDNNLIDFRCCAGRSIASVL